MSKSEDRVLIRLHARLLTEEELEQVPSGFMLRPRCTIDLVTCTMDGICSPPPAC